MEKESIRIIFNSPKIRNILGITPYIGEELLTDHIRLWATVKRIKKTGWKSKNSILIRFDFEYDEEINPDHLIEWDNKVFSPTQKINKTKQQYMVFAYLIGFIKNDQ